MKIEIEISEEKIISDVEARIAKEIAEQVWRDYRREWSHAAILDTVREVSKDMTREVIEKDIENLSNQAVKAAAKTIERRAIVRLVEEVVHKSEGTSWT